MVPPELPCGREPNLALLWNEPSASRGHGEGEPAVRRDAGTDSPHDVLAEEDSCGHAVHGFATAVAKVVARDNCWGHAVHGFAPNLFLTVTAAVASVATESPSAIAE